MNTKQSQQQHPSLRVEEWLKRFPALLVFRLKRKNSLKEFEEKQPRVEDMKDWWEIREGILVDKDTGMPFAIVVSVQRTEQEREEIATMVWDDMKKWNSFPLVLWQKTRSFASYSLCVALLKCTLWWKASLSLIFLHKQQHRNRLSTGSM